MGWSHETQVLSPVPHKSLRKGPLGACWCSSHPICGPTISCCPGWGCWTPLGLGWESRTTHQEEPEEISPRLPAPSQYTNLPRVPTTLITLNFMDFGLGPTPRANLREACVSDTVTMVYHWHFPLQTVQLTNTPGRILPPALLPPFFLQGEVSVFVQS